MVKVALRYLVDSLVDVAVEADYPDGLTDSALSMLWTCFIQLVKVRSDAGKGVGADLEQAQPEAGPKCAISSSESALPENKAEKSRLKPGETSPLNQPVRASPSISDDPAGQKAPSGPRGLEAGPGDSPYEVWRQPL